MAQIQGILFDNDGTLIDTHDLILSSMRYSTQQVLGDALPDEKLMAKVGQPLAVQMKDFSPDPAVQEEILRVYRDHNHAHHDDAIALFPGIKECLAELHEQGVKMGVVTSKLHELAWRGLTLMGLAPYLDCLVGADDCDEYKPNPGPVIKGAQLLGLEPQECLYVGDSPFDMAAGRDAGCVTVAVTWGMFPLERLQEVQPDHIIDEPHELVALMQHLS